MMKFIKRIFDAIAAKWNYWQSNRRMKKRIKELKKRDPFIYK